MQEPDNADNDTDDEESFEGRVEEEDHQEEAETNELVDDVEEVVGLFVAVDVLDGGCRRGSLLDYWLIDCRSGVLFEELKILNLIN